jgi:general stress protein 26
MRVPMTEDEKVSKVNELIHGIHVCMLTTHSGDGALRSRPMAVQEAEFDGNLWFFTGLRSGKHDDLIADTRVNISFCDLKANSFVSLTGRATFINDRHKMKQLWKPILKIWFPEGLDDPNLGLLKVDCQDAEYWDAPAGVGMALAMAKSYVTGDDSALADNERVRL